LPYQEPLLITLVRTGLIALAIGLGITGRNLAQLPAATSLALWPSLGGHYVEIGFLNVLRPRLPSTRFGQIAGRIATWFIGGMILALGMKLTATALPGLRPLHWLRWWMAGLAFIGIELVVHLVLQLSGRPSFYNGRG